MAEEKQENRKTPSLRRARARPKRLSGGTHAVGASRRCAQTDAREPPPPKQRSVEERWTPLTTGQGSRRLHNLRPPRRVPRGRPHVHHPHRVASALARHAGGIIRVASPVIPAYPLPRPPPPPPDARRPRLPPPAHAAAVVVVRRRRLSPPSPPPGATHGGPRRGATSLPDRPAASEAVLPTRSTAAARGARVP